MSNLSRRSFIAGSAITAGLLGLAGCSSDPKKRKGKGFTETATDFGYTIVDNGTDGAKLSYSPESGLKIIEVDGFGFKDFEGTGELVPYEDWRLPAEERAEDLAKRVSIEQIAGLMCFSMHQHKIEDEGVVNDEQKAFLDGHVRAVLNAASGYPAFKQAQWANHMQAYVEGSSNKIPINFSSDPRSGKNCANWPGNLALAATFDPKVAKEAGAGIASDMRKMGVTMFLGPQTDIASDPRWARFNGTFGEDPALSRDMCRSLIDGLQSTVNEKGEDMGWGTGSLVAMVKHWPAEGAGEGGREGHTDGGKFAVYPNNNFEPLMIPFVDGAFKLEGKTGQAGSIMTSYTIAYDENKQYGELVGSGFSKYKVQDLLRDRFGFKGSACTDWAVLMDVDSKGPWTCWGLEDGSKWDSAKRASKAVEVGVDQMGGWNDPSQLMVAYEDMKANLGEEKAEENFRASAKRLLLGYFNTGLFENPYVDVDVARKEVDGAPEDVTKAALDAQVKGIVMIKNHDGVIKKGADGAKPKVYVPMRYTAAAKTVSRMGAVKWTEASSKCELPLTKGTLEKYFDFKTDTLSESLTGPADAKTGNPTPTTDDLTRLTAADIADVDAVLVCAVAPNNASSRRGQDENGEFIPLSVQYRPYTADNEFVRQTSIAGDTLPDGSKENRSYYGKTSMITNEAQLDQILEAAELAHEAGKPCIVILDITQPMCVHEFEDKVDAILISMSGSTEAACRIVAGQDEPSGLLPMQMPKDMLAVEKQQEDLYRDMDCYSDADGNEYDFGFGLNWSGAISDERTKKYCVPALTKLEA
ncbi:glycoside hydrolase family 3 N-terminal domain-containing protein [Olsenella urininfantis]|uniref:glycoside hydrolase family 3 N-terminal domain-containing protein n=1 Tax=Olsenella urininfantis TaxID=1871033 RepID=UPI000984A2E4|nr:glycoside hydrolase family 3 N-terminal domain-containing protein [Olsenella urininfantis]